MSYRDINRNMISYKIITRKRRSTTYVLYVVKPCNEKRIFLSLIWYTTSQISIFLPEQKFLYHIRRENILTIKYETWFTRYTYSKIEKYILTI